MLLQNMNRLLRIRSFVKSREKSSIFNISFNFPNSNHFLANRNIQVNRFSTVPEGFVGFIEHQLRNPGDTTDGFVSRQRLESAFVRLQDCLKDQEDLKSLLSDPSTDSEMLELAGSDIKKLEDIGAELVDELTDILIPATEYDTENAVIEVTFQGFAIFDYSKLKLKTEEY